MLVEPLDNGLSKYTPQCLDAVVAVDKRGDLMRVKLCFIQRKKAFELSLSTLFDWFPG